MKKIMKYVLWSLLLLPLSSRADEGMWLPMLVERLNYVDMQRMGLQLTAAEIYNINHSSLKDAIVQFGGGCTGELVSDQGLLFTNHHCGYGQIQSHSTVENNILRDGFWAYSKDQELPNPGLTAKFLVRMEDVSAQVMATLKEDMSESDRNQAIRKLSRELEKKAVEGTHYTADVRSFFNNNEFYLFVYETFLDVRLVGTPPEAVGKFGADADNWMWPRHTGDFSIFRIYMGPDGKPAAYAKENVPYKPKHFLPVSLDGVKAGDFAMIMGYPGRTNRFANSHQLENAIQFQNPSIVKVREKKLEIMDEFSDLDPAVRIQYAAKYAGIANYWKYYIGQTKQLKNNKVVEKKRKIEESFQKEYASNPRYSSVLSTIKAAHQAMGQYQVANTVYGEAVRSVPVFVLAANLEFLAKEWDKQGNSPERVKMVVERVQKAGDNYFENHLPLERKMTWEMLAVYASLVPEDQQAPTFVVMARKYKNDFEKMFNDLSAKSLFWDAQKFKSFMENPTQKALDKDAVYQLYKSLSAKNAEIAEKVMPHVEPLQAAERLFVEGYRLMNPGKKIAPDANSTMRVTYGTILDYDPADAVHYDFKTTLSGVMQKEDPGNFDFVVPARLKELYEKKDYGIYAENGEIVTCFLSTTDITGGNSGSPILNAKGELIGLAFDGNWEAMSGDIFYEPALQRTINVDIRYVLFIIDKFAGAKNLIEEMSLRSR